MGTYGLNYAVRGNQIPNFKGTLSSVVRRRCDPLICPIGGYNGITLKGPLISHPRQLYLTPTSPQMWWICQSTTFYKCASWSIETLNRHNNNWSWVQLLKNFLYNQFNGISGNYWQSSCCYIKDMRFNDLDLLAPNFHYPIPILVSRSVSSHASHTLRWHTLRWHTLRWGCARECAIPVSRLKGLQYIDDDCPEEFYHGAIPHWYKLQEISWSAVVDRPAKPVMVCPTSRSQVTVFPCERVASRDETSLGEIRHLSWKVFQRVVEKNYF